VKEKKLLKEERQPPTTLGRRSEREEGKKKNLRKRSGQENPASLNSFKEKNSGRNGTPRRKRSPSEEGKRFIQRDI